MNADKGVVERMTDAAQALLDSLSADQRRLAEWAFPSDEERLRWFLSWSTTAPRATRTTRIPSGATRSATSAWTRGAIAVKEQ